MSPPRKLHSIVGGRSYNTITGENSSSLFDIISSLYSAFLLAA
jgi:hypothetical protein